MKMCPGKENYLYLNGRYNLEINLPTGSVVNDGGLSWLRKNYQRMKEQAEREQRSLDDVVADRYGVRTDGWHTFSIYVARS